MTLTMRNNKRNSNIATEWDSICEERQQMIEQGRDPSLTLVTAPCIIKNVQSKSPRYLIDVGCGTGYLTNQLAAITERCIGIDISTMSIRIAKATYKRNNLEFEHCSIAEYSSEIVFDACTANMVFSADVNWLESLKKIHGLLCGEGRIYLIIPHPCFWPQYWKYQDEVWFHYNQEMSIKHEFATSLTSSMGITTHIHRSLEQYINGLIECGFIIEKIEEPYPAAPPPSNYCFSYPRFLFIQGKKIQQVMHRV